MSRILLTQPPSWVLPPYAGLGFDFDFANGLYWQKGKIYDPNLVLVTSRASTATDLLPTSSSGFAYTTFTSGVPVISPTIGLFAFEARTNRLLNSAVPATQTTASLATGTYTLWCNGSGNVTSSAGTAVGTGFGVASQGAPNTIVLTGAGTVVLTVGGSLNAFQLELGTFGTPLIVTAGVVVTRAADVITSRVVPAFGSAATLYAEATPLAPDAFAATQMVFQASNGAADNVIGIFRAATSSEWRSIYGNGSQMAGPLWPSNQKNKGLVAVTSDSQKHITNIDGVLSFSATAGFPTINKITIGSRYNGATQFNGIISRVAVWPTSMLSDSILQGLAT